MTALSPETLERRLKRERAARLEAERLLDEKSRELFQANEHLREAKADLELRVLRRTAALKQAHEEAEAAHKAKAEFVADMSHELRTPLNSVIGFGEVIRDRMLGDLDDQYAAYGGHIVDAGSQLMRLITNILDISSAEAGEIELNETCFRASRVIDDVVLINEDRAQDAGLRVLVDKLDADVMLRADLEKVSRILVNLLSNAIKFTPNGGRVKISGARRDDGAFRFTVADTGVGMTREEQQAALVPFQQIENVLAADESGAGLGLPFCLQMAEEHGGSLTLESQKYVGTKAFLTLPAERVNVDAAPAATPQAATDATVLASA